jgi:hypothetical protein
MIQLHPNCRARLIETIADAIPSIVVTYGKFISYSSVTKLVTADNVIPTRGTVRNQLTTYINETPVSTFVLDLLQSELLQFNQFQQGKPSMNLTNIVGYEDPRQVAEKLVDQISSLPWQYKLTIRLPQQLVPLLPSGENSIVLNDQIELVRASDIFQKLYPLETDRASTPTSGLFWAWETLMGAVSGVHANYCQRFHWPVRRFNSGVEGREHFARFLRSRFCAQIVQSHTQISIIRAEAIVAFYQTPATF